MPRARRQRGFTLAELLAVLAIIGVLTVVATFAVGSANRGRGPADLARTLLVAMSQARGESVGDGFQRRLLCTSTSCTYQIATAAGMTTPPGWASAGGTVNGGADGVVWAILPSVKIGSVDPGAGPVGAATAVTFYPDGTASPATVFVCDPNKIHQFKLYVFAGTGLPHLSDKW